MSSTGQLPAMPGIALMHRMAARSWTATAGLAITCLLALAAVLAPWLTGGDPADMDFNAIMAPPSPAHFFGTDNFGRDVLTRVIFGLQVSLVVAISSVALALVAGVPLGLFAGYRGGWVGTIIMRTTDVFMAFPAIVFVVALAGIFGASISLMVLSITLIFVPIIVRVTAGASSAIKNELYIEGAQARGASHVRIMAIHILPNALAIIAVQASALMGIAILFESALSFIGLGVQPPTPSLGLMLAENRPYMGDAPWLVLGPGGCILLAVLGFNLFGDGLPSLFGRSQRG